MLVKYWACLVFAGFGMAFPGAEGRSEIHDRSVQDTPSLRSAMAGITAAIQAYDASLKKVTADNTASSLKDVNAKAHVLGTAMENGAKAVAASPPLKGIQDAIGLITPSRAYANALNETTMDLMTKMDIITRSNQTALVLDALKSQKPGFIAFSKALMTQIPASMRTQIPKNFAQPSDAQMNDLLDDLIAQVGAIMDGKAMSFTMPPALPGIMASMGVMSKREVSGAELPTGDKTFRIRKIRQAFKA